MGSPHGDTVCWPAGAGAARARPRELGHRTPSGGTMSERMERFLEASAAVASHPLPAQPPPAISAAGLHQQRSRQGTHRLATQAGSASVDWTAHQQRQLQLSHGQALRAQAEEQATRKQLARRRQYSASPDHALRAFAGASSTAAAAAAAAAGPRADPPPPQASATTGVQGSWATLPPPFRR
jgi:hypothetical protein